MVSFSFYMKESLPWLETLVSNIKIRQIQFRDGEKVRYPEKDTLN